MPHYFSVAGNFFQRQYCIITSQAADLSLYCCNTSTRYPALYLRIFQRCGQHGVLSPSFLVHCVVAFHRYYNIGSQPIDSPRYFLHAFSGILKTPCRACLRNTHAFRAKPPTSSLQLVGITSRIQHDACHFSHYLPFHIKRFYSKGRSSKCSFRNAAFFYYLNTHIVSAIFFVDYNVK